MKKSIAALLTLVLASNALAECEIMPTNGLIVCYGEEYVPSLESDSAETDSAETATQGAIGKDEEDVKAWILEKPQKPVSWPGDND